ncbi:MAG: phospho-N-acetylmuramoyl-pentapeptide-transferase, partial [Candidatus Aureabacteria bacterium]|nr:phospho-N-acetylmuramoyl-pentapeptide-transferase [Candidatus Auribacterota bacterium]
MLYFLSYLKDYFFVFNVFRYITFRAAFAAMTSMVLTLFLGPYIIKKLYEMKIGQNIRKEECPPLYSLHKSKEGTPTMGGVLIVLVVVLSTLLWADIRNEFILIVTLSIIWFGGIGFIDDYLKLKR